MKPAATARSEVEQALDRAEALHKSGSHSEAEGLVLELLGSGVTTSAVYRLLAGIQSRLNKPLQEARALEQALATSTADAAPEELLQLWLRLAAVRAWLGNHSAALDACRRASQIDPANKAARQGVARARLALQDLEGARHSAEELQRMFPDSAFSHLFSGHVHKAAGEAPAARECYLQALEREPDLGEALYNLVDLAVPAPGDAIAISAAKLAGRDDAPCADKINAGFAHARILDGAGRHAEAFEAFRGANDLAREEMSRRGIEYIPARVEARIADIINEYPAPSFASGLDDLPVDVAPVFILGLPRSGTTLIEQILASHREVQTAGEVGFARECEDEFRRRRAAAGRARFVDPADPVDAELLETAREQYIEKLFERDLDGPWIIDKLPANFEIAGFLRLMFPRSPIVHCVRNPQATCFSLYCANFFAHEPWYHDLGHLAHYYRQYSRLMSHWRKVIPAPFVDIGYEQLVQDRQSQIPALLKAVGLPFDASCLEPHMHDRPVFTASHAQVRRPIYTSAVEHWKHYAEWLGPLDDI